MKTIILAATTFFISSMAMASFDLASNGKTVTCVGETNQTIALNAARTSIDYVTNHGKMKLQVTDATSDNEVFTTYESNILKLTLSNFGDSIQYGDYQQAVTCK